ncbi:S24 family peptidase [Paracidovorax cattleyae]|uniref:S24 family peptidase n=1 Tax=Paracidovorax cattleyae TaxID=80868 RepID=UPI001E4517DB|nr:S24 family peptidase [Paracidovorax cattleyae]
MVPAPATPSNAVAFGTNKIRDVFVVGKGNGGLMAERVWSDGDYPVGATDECAEVATSDPQAFLVLVEGDSMSPRYNRGEYALVEPQTEPELEDDVLVRLATGQTMIKRLLSRRDGWRFGSYNSAETLHYRAGEVSWVYYVAHPIPRRKIKARC